MFWMRRFFKKVLIIGRDFFGLPWWLSSGAEGDVVLIPGSGRSPGEGNGNLLQHSCLENPMDRGAWWAAFRGVAKSWTCKDCVVVQWLRLCAPSAGGPGSIPGQGTGCHMPQLAQKSKLNKHFFKKESSWQCILLFDAIFNSKEKKKIPCYLVLGLIT